MRTYGLTHTRSQLILVADVPTDGFETLAAPHTALLSVKAEAPRLNLFSLPRIVVEVKPSPGGGGGLGDAPARVEFRLVRGGDKDAFHSFGGALDKTRERAVNRSRANPEDEFDLRECSLFCHTSEGARVFRWFWFFVVCVWLQRRMVARDQALLPRRRRTSRRTPRPTRPPATSLERWTGSLDVWRSSVGRQDHHSVLLPYPIGGSRLACIICTNLNDITSECHQLDFHSPGMLQTDTTQFERGQHTVNDRSRSNKSVGREEHDNSTRPSATNQAPWPVAQLKETRRRPPSAPQCCALSLTR